MVIEIRFRHLNSTLDLTVDKIKTQLTKKHRVTKKVRKRAACKKKSLTFFSAET